MSAVILPFRQWADSASKPRDLTHLDGERWQIKRERAVVTDLTERILHKQNLGRKGTRSMEFVRR
jgi:hypothetical protein